MSRRMPAVKELNPGIYYWCRCGKTGDQPFCDDSHQGTPVEPLEFRVREKKTIALCNCQKTRNAPICDGTHKKLM